ncbi:hypothetical protein QFC21_002507 [Naganishia friedmannii]|uniref:Uncharacterized protein n=1 Tax=Naganishia friedmannii TaxID=89922 RepID=A0ACC2VVF6_9TREE|nr:hypothetical protein QFC21_002507 [Naganishia friedmannii]
MSEMLPIISTSSQRSAKAGSNGFPPATADDHYSQSVDEFCDRIYVLNDWVMSSWEADESPPGPQVTWSTSLSYLLRKAEKIKLLPDLTKSPQANEKGKNPAGSPMPAESLQEWNIRARETRQELNRLEDPKAFLASFPENSQVDVFILMLDLLCAFDQWDKATIGWRQSKPEYHGATVPSRRRSSTQLEEWAKTLEPWQKGLYTARVVRLGQTRPGDYEKCSATGLSKRSDTLDKQHESVNSRATRITYSAAATPISFNAAPSAASERWTGWGSKNSATPAATGDQSRAENKTGMLTLRSKASVKTNLDGTLSLNDQAK